MKRFIQGFVVGFCCPIVLVSILAILTGAVSAIFRSPQLEGGFDRLEYGMSQADVVKLMGADCEQTAEVPLGTGYLRMKRYDMSYAVMVRIKAVCYLSWKGGDLTYVVAFDEAERVLYKAKFGT